MLMVLVSIATAVCIVCVAVIIASGASNNFRLSLGMPLTPVKTGVGEPPAGALVGESLSNFLVDNSLVFPRGAAPEIQNITQIGPRTFNFLLRHRGNPWTPLNPKGTKGAWYDGDRNLEWNEGKQDNNYHDKSRAEMVFRNLRMAVGETWELATTVRLNPDFVPAPGYTDIMQPVFDLSYLTLTDLHGDAVTAQLMVFTNGIGSQNRMARQFTIQRGQWTPIVVRIKFAQSGRCECSVNGDAFRGISLDTTKGRQPFSAKWGLYMPATKDIFGKPLRDSVVQHRNIYARKV